MQPQPPKSIGGALVDVFDAAMALVKTEIRLVARRVGNVAKEKGLGALLLLAAAAPLSLALIFLILALFYGLIALGLPSWASALIIAILALVVTGILVMLGIRRLTAEVKDDTPTEQDLVREDVGRAEKKLDKAEKDLEKNVEKGEKRVDSAERALERARDQAQRYDAPSSGSSSAPRAAYDSGATSSSSSTSSSSASSVTSATPIASNSRVVLTPDTTAGTSPIGSTPSASTFDNPNMTNSNVGAGARRRSAEDDGIPVSTKPQLDEIDKEDRK
ncbi:phage holin family protein [Deinococcus yavapaiensis]|uniref:Putative superfamily III holin-X n=1 Tax=Deinococcus yavapaiensis KR-236 TaxID=694435 RepID=A0A318SJQ0_9DEIO|nr:phage holin family protein [Deinococcus yavapaiensis]PYE54506.1 putative superfamily III holin-X [Deinococcus yavapaiensis KR-236]